MQFYGDTIEEKGSGRAVHRYFLLIWLQTLMEQKPFKTPVRLVHNYD